MDIHHIGYLVKNIKPAIAGFEALGYHLTDGITYDHIRDIHICFMQNGGYVIELICPASKASPLYPLLKKMHNAPYHICYHSSRFDEEVAALSENGYVLADPPCPAPAIQNKRVAFLMNLTVGLIEILES